MAALQDQGWLAQRGDVYELGHRVGFVLVAYVGRTSVHTGLFSPSGRPIDIDVVERLREPRRETNLRGLLRDVVESMIGLLRRNDLESAGGPSAIAVALPAALTPDGERVVGDEPQGWTRITSLTDVLQRQWSDAAQRLDLPPLPTTSDGRPAVVVDSDAVFDTTAAMYSRRATVHRHDPSGAGVVLGVACAGGVRSTLIFRQPGRLPPQVDADEPWRRPGERRDLVLRGASGDTAGIGHTPASLQRSSEPLAGHAGDAEGYWESIRDVKTCTCGRSDVPHLELFTTHDALAARLGVQVTDVAGLLRGDGDHSLGDHGDRVLRETGRLLASAVDTGVRLYDPEAVFVSGPISDSDIVWDALREEAHLATSERRSLMRARDLATDTDGPIGLQGGATLALDTWVYPHALAALRRGPRHSADVRP